MVDQYHPPFSSSPKLVYFVVIPLIMVSALVLILNHKPSSSFSLSLHLPPQQPLSLTHAAPPPVVESNRKYVDLDIVEASLAKARANIHETLSNNESSYDGDYIPEGPFYRNPNGEYVEDIHIRGGRTPAVPLQQEPRHPGNRRHHIVSEPQTLSRPTSSFSPSASSPSSPTLTSYTTALGIPCRTSLETTSTSSPLAILTGIALSPIGCHDWVGN